MKLTLLVIGLCSVLCPALLTAATTCESLTSLKLDGAIVTRAEAAGEAGTLPAHCRVAATLKPSADSDIKIEVWLPASGWNGKFQAVGNGGWAGSISYPAMGLALRRGYATASTDTGHTGGRGEFVHGHPEKLVDYAYRAVHEMTVKSKAIVAAYYGGGPKLSYWNGCSTGGKQALVEAQSFPDDFDGIIAGAPGNFRTHHAFSQLWAAHAMLKEPASYIPRAKHEMIHKAAVKACDALDGLQDGLISDPSRCRFDPKELECKGEDSLSCLTAPQVEAARKIYAGPKDSRTGSPIFPAVERGSELGWSSVAGAAPYQVAVDYFKYVVFEDANWDWRKLDFGSHVDLSDKRERLTNATDPHLEKFFARGGKLLMYHGWGDPTIAPQNSINYYKSVADTLGGVSKIDQSLRLFMAPGMGHCGGGDGPNVVESVDALEQWVEKGKAPEQLAASHSTAGKVDRTRPLCPYPQVAKYTGSGSTDDAANFVCAAPAP